MGTELFILKAHESSMFSLFGDAAWDECVELQVTPKDTWLSNSKTLMEMYDRVEVLVHVAGNPAGGCVIMIDDYDAHVGKCACVGFCYVDQRYRNEGVAKQLLREALRFARDNGQSILKYSHRLGPWKYAINYMKV